MRVGRRNVDIVVGNRAMRASKKESIVYGLFWCIEKMRGSVLEGSRQSCGVDVSLDALGPVMDFGK